MSNWNFDIQDQEEVAYEISLENIRGNVELHKSQLTSETSIISVDPPKFVSKPLPTPIDSKSISPKHKSLIHDLVTNIKTKSLLTNLPLSKQTSDSSIETVHRSQFDPIDSKLTCELNARCQTLAEPNVIVVRTEEEMKFLLKNRKGGSAKNNTGFIRPTSPGSNQNKSVTFAEIGIPAPRFKADVHNLVYQQTHNNTCKEVYKINKLIKEAKKVEQDIKDKYQKNLNISCLEDRTISHLKQMKKNRKRSRNISN
jgi:hypothetical protein